MFNDFDLAFNPESALAAARATKYSSRSADSDDDSDAGITDDDMPMSSKLDRRILTRIAAYVGSQHDRTSFCLVCRDWALAGESSLWAYPSFASPEQLARFLRTVAEKPNVFAPRIRGLRFTLDTQYDRHLALDCRRESGEIEQATVLELASGGHVLSPSAAVLRALLHGSDLMQPALPLRFARMLAPVDSLSLYGYKLKDKHIVNDLMRWHLRDLSIVGMPRRPLANLGYLLYNLRTLRGLRLESDSALPADIWGPLAIRLPTLQRLRICAPGIRGAQLMNAAGRVPTGLRVFHMVGKDNDAGDELVEFILRGSAATLQSLVVHSANITARSAIMAMALCPRLTHLELVRDAPEGVGDVPQDLSVSASQLHTLCLRNLAIPDQLVQAAASTIASLHTLHISGAPSLTGAPLGALLAASTALVALGLRNNPLVGDEAMAGLAQSPSAANLQALLVEQCSVQSAGIEQAIPFLPSVKRLAVMGTEIVHHKYQYTVDASSVPDIDGQPQRVEVSRHFVPTYPPGHFSADSTSAEIPPFSWADTSDAYIPGLLVPAVTEQAGRAGRRRNTVSAEEPRDMDGEPVRRLRSISDQPVSVMPIIVPDSEVVTRSPVSAELYVPEQMDRVDVNEVMERHIQAGAADEVSQEESKSGIAAATAAAAIAAAAAAAAATIFTDSKTEDAPVDGEESVSRDISEAISTPFADVSEPIETSAETEETGEPVAAEATEAPPAADADSATQDIPGAADTLEKAADVPALSVQDAANVSDDAVEDVRTGAESAAIESVPNAVPTEEQVSGILAESVAEEPPMASRDIPAQIDSAGEADVSVPVAEEIPAGTSSEEQIADDGPAVPDIQEEPAAEDSLEETRDAAIPTDTAGEAEVPAEVPVESALTGPADISFEEQTIKGDTLEPHDVPIPADPDTTSSPAEDISAMPSKNVSTTGDVADGASEQPPAEADLTTRSLPVTDAAAGSTLDAELPEIPVAASETSAVDEPISGAELPQPVGQEAVVEEPVTEEPASEEPVVVEPVGEKAVGEEVVTEEAVGEVHTEPIADTLVVDIVGVDSIVESALGAIQPTEHVAEAVTDEPAERALSEPETAAADSGSANGSEKSWHDVSADVDESVASPDVSATPEDIPQEKPETAEQSAEDAAVDTINLADEPTAQEPADSPGSVPEDSPAHSGSQPGAVSDSSIGIAGALAAAGAATGASLAALASIFSKSSKAPVPAMAEEVPKATADELVETGASEAPETPAEDTIITEVPATEVPVEEAPVQVNASVGTDEVPADEAAPREIVSEQDTVAASKSPPVKEPTTEEPAATEEPAVEEPAEAEEPAAAEEPPTVEHTTKEPAAIEEPTKAEELAATEEPAAEEPAVEEPAIEEPAAVEEPAAMEEPAVEEPAEAEEPTTAEEPAAEDPAVEEPAVEEPAAEKPAKAEEPAAMEEPAVEPTTKEPAVLEEPAAEKPAKAEELAATEEPA
ncbi:hypothetical protein EC988_001139, partial [Linderina pennispora]